ncbi:MAG: hypothetical protein M1828_002063 [Chrysothrix sp. TS-e1954]|nr:MAG: hypothetical protein M1828_002063 [Chrysothrix sp. TS-e1954]
MENFITPKPSDPLYFVSYDADKPTSLLFIHGAFGSYHEYGAVSKHLPDYHVLIPNLHSYGPSTEISLERPLRLPETSDLLADLIRDHAKGQRAHVVGCSMGASIALDLASRHPDVIDRLFVTGYSGFGQSSPTTRKLLPYGYWAEQGLESLIPRSLITWAMSGELPPSTHGPRKSIATCQAVVSVCSTAVVFGKIKARTLVCAAGKRSTFLPTDDNVDAARGAWRGVKEGEGRHGEAGMSVCVVLPEMRHPWWILKPELFARCVESWIGKGEMLGVGIGVEVLGDNKTIM